MLSTLLINGDLVSGQWALVIGIGLAFFLVQIALSASFYFRMSRHERAIQRLCRDFERGGNGRPRAVLRNFAWLNWVISSFPTEAPHAPGNFTREDVLQELDTRIASNGDYLLLQRMGVMAPLLGVVLTVAGFYWLNVSEQDQSLKSILLTVTPLISGVGTGAVLALVNQSLLHIAGRRVESLRMLARTWFDTVIWSHCGLDTQNSTVKAVQAMERLVRNTLADINRLSDTVARAAEINAAISALPDQIRNILDRKVQVDHDAASTGSSARPVTRISARPR